eukprot:TRINITY_DN2987_c0_g1_i1.p1 TRINITY_DN2987_c0_g1~~TRINITY_DN2987_c0_g1_i1.p1  ORF type:complete len:100 (+),score=37.76 TRINITY_DN2987_c0_g1_i1:195-494(+)
MCIRDSYNMAGNVNEWVQDVYRPLSFQEMDDMNPARRDAVGDSETGYDGAYTFIGNEREYSEEEWVKNTGPVSYTHLRAHETVLDLVCRLLLEKKKNNN